MNGQSLHSKYLGHQAAGGLEGTSWGELDDTSKDAWDELAGEVQLSGLIQLAESSLTDVQLEVHQTRAGEWRIELVGIDPIDGTTCDWSEESPKLQKAAQAIIEHVKGWMGP